MIDITFMQSKFSLDTMIDHYLADIKSLRSPSMPEDEENRLKRYYQAARVFKGIGIRDIVQFALSFGRAQKGKVPLMVKAFPILLANDIHMAKPVDIAYLHILLEYATAFQLYVHNLKDWTLRVVLSSRFSPVKPYFDREIAFVIENTHNKIQS